MIEFINPLYRELLTRHRLHNFTAFWSLPRTWFEEPNYRRQGWSGVSTHRLANGGEHRILFVKRQENHDFRSLAHPGGRPTFYKEYRNLLALERRRLATPTLVYYGERRSAAGRQAVLATWALSGYHNLDDWLARPETETGRDADLEEIGRQVRRLHDLGFQHRALYGKHLLRNPKLPVADGGLVFIDLEKARHWPLMTVRLRAADLVQLQRHSPGLGPGEVQALLQGYLFDRPSWAAKLQNAITYRLEAKRRQRS